jgi:hypothetical protein
LARKPLYACGTCGLDFTRSYNAKRHNKNLHDNKADIVTFSEYMVGRTSGKYPPPANPLLYRIKNSNSNKGHIVHQYEDDKKLLISISRNIRWILLELIPLVISEIICQVHVINLASKDTPLCVSYYRVSRDRETRKKQETEELLYQVGEMFSDLFLLNEWRALTGFKSRLDSATDYTTIHALYTELENDRTRLFDIALGRATWSNTLDCILPNSVNT